MDDVVKPRKIDSEYLRSIGATPLEDILPTGNAEQRMKFLRDLDDRDRKAHESWTASPLLDEAIGADTDKKIKMQIVHIVRDRVAVTGFEELQIQAGIEEIHRILPEASEEALRKLWSVPSRNLWFSKPIPKTE